MAKYTILVNSRHGKYIYRGAGSEGEVREDMKTLKNTGVNPERMEVIPVTGEPRIEERIVYKDRVIPVKETVEITKTIPVSNPSERSKNIAIGFGIGAVVTGAIAVMVYRRSRKKKESNK